MVPLGLPLSIGAAAAVPRLVERVPTPAQFVDVLRTAGDRLASATAGLVGSGSPNSARGGDSLASAGSVDVDAAAAGRGRTASITDERDLTALLRRRVDQALGRLRGEVHRVLAKHGVDAARTVRLRADREGSLAVVDTRDAEAIEAALRDDPRVASAVRAALDALAALEAVEHPATEAGAEAAPFAALQRGYHREAPLAAPLSQQPAGSSSYTLILDEWGSRAVRE
jgi:hypothetical protein